MYMLHTLCSYMLDQSIYTIMRSGACAYIGFMKPREQVESLWQSYYSTVVSAPARLETD
jgi:hypothetical protein